MPAYATSVLPQPGGVHCFVHCQVLLMLHTEVTEELGTCHVLLAYAENS